MYLIYTFTFLLKPILYKNLYIIIHIITHFSHSPLFLQSIILWYILLTTQLIAYLSLIPSLQLFCLSHTSSQVLPYLSLCWFSQGMRRTSTYKRCNLCSKCQHCYYMALIVWFWVHCISFGNRMGRDNCERKFKVD